MRVESRNHALNRAAVTAAGGERLVEWDILRGFANPVELEGLGAAVHLAGESVSASGRPRNAGESTTAASRGAAAVPGAFDLAIAPGGAGRRLRGGCYYGSRGIHVVDEDSPQGEGFLAEVAADPRPPPAPPVGRVFASPPRGWESSLAREAGRWRRCCRIFTPAWAGGWATAGSSGAGFPLRTRWEHSHHHPKPRHGRTGQRRHAQPRHQRPVHPRLGSVLSRPTLLTMPALALRLAMGRMADEVLLSSVPRSAPAIVRERLSLHPRPA